MNVYAVLGDLAQYRSVLDVGTGHGTVIGKIAKRAGLAKLVGIDACDRSLSIARRRHPGVMFKLCDVRELITEFGPKSFGAVVGFDIVEHLVKDEARQLIADAERVAREVVWWFVPIGDHPQEFDPRNEGNEELQRHRSIWKVEEFVQLGYDVWYYPDWHSRGRGYVDTGKSTEAAFCRKTIGSSGPGRLIEGKRYTDTTKA